MGFLNHISEQFCILQNFHAKIKNSFRVVHYRPDVYQRYIDHVYAESVYEGIQLTSATAREMFAFEKKLTMENMWIPGIEGANYFRDIGIEMIDGDTTVGEAVAKMNNELTTKESIWTKRKNLKPWIDRFYPGTDIQYSEDE